MKIKSVTIKGMRGVSSKKYDFDEINYLMGENGSGKSTVIDSLSLAILGYIPGTPKQNKKIMENANGQVMAASVELSNDNGDVIQVDRTWIRKGQSVESTLSVTPEGADIAHLISSTEIPVYNFSDLLSKSANEQKDFFIKNILSASDAAVDINKKISDKIAHIDLKYRESIESEILAQADKYGPEVSSVQIVQNLNSYLKQLQSLKKSQIAEAENTLSTLVKADDSEVTRTSEEIKADIDKVDDQITRCKMHIVRESSMKKWEISAGDLINEVDSFDDTLDVQSTPEYAALIVARNTYNDKYNELNDKINDADRSIQSFGNKITILTKTIEDLQKTIASGGICHYTKKECPEIKKMIETLKEHVNENSALKEDVVKLIEAENTKKNALIEERNKLADDLVTPQAAYDRVVNKITKLKTLKQSKPEVSNYDGPELSILEDEKSALSEAYKEAVNAEQYEKLHDKLVAKKAKYEVELDIIKLLIKYTGPNELQNELMEEPFNVFADAASSQIQKLFVDDKLTMKFDLSAKSNTFSFGLSREGGYIPFSTLSSGEKCLYMISFIMTVLKNQKGDFLKVIILDDVLDHLDKQNAKIVFDTISEMNEGIQFIMAGVVDCKSKSVKKIKV